MKILHLFLFTSFLFICKNTHPMLTPEEINFIKAVIDGDHAEVKKALEAGVNVNVKFHTTGNTVLTELIKELKQDDDGRLTPEQLQTVQNIADYQNRLNILYTLLTYKPELNHRPTRDEAVTALERAVKYDKGGLFVKALIDAGADITLTKYLEYAIESGKNKAIQALLDAGIIIPDKLSPDFVKTLNYKITEINNTLKNNLDKTLLSWGAFIETLNPQSTSQDSFAIPAPVADTLKTLSYHKYPTVSEIYAARKKLAEKL